jgi:hypothetical protein
MHELPLERAQRQLMRVERAKSLLAHVRTVTEAREIRDRAAAAQFYLRAREDSHDAAQNAGEIKVRAERRLGDLLRETVNQKTSAGRPKKNGRTLRPISTGRLPDGVSKSQSSRWQQAATVPEKAFETYVADCRTTGKMITSEGVRKLANVAKFDMRRTKARQAAKDVGGPASRLVGREGGSEAIGRAVSAGDWEMSTGG